MREEKQMKQLQIPNIDLNKELNKCKSTEDLVGKNGLMQKLFGNIIQQFLEAEMEEHLCREKYETVCNELDKKVIGLYSRGVSVDDIKTEIDELYGVDISPAMISKITDKVIETAIAWQNRKALGFGCQSVMTSRTEE